VLWVTATVTPVLVILFCLSGNFFLSVALLALVGAGQAACRTISRVILQIQVPYGLLGRVMSVFQMDTGMRSLGSIVIGTFATLFGAALGLALTSTVSLALTSALFFHLLGSVRRRFSLAFLVHILFTPSVESAIRNARSRHLLIPHSEATANSFP
jgi:hypothetical protein